MAKITIKFDNLAHIDEKIDEAVKDLKHDFIEAMRTDLMKLPYTYNKMFPYNRTEYVKRDDVLRIFDKYSVGDEEANDKNNV
jgi:hypothetical protein